MNPRRGYDESGSSGNHFHKCHKYDAVGRQTAVIDALGNRADSIYDEDGQLIVSANALLQITRYEYDAKGRRVATNFPDGSFTTNSYNAIGQLVFSRDQAGLETDYQYDNLGRMTNIIKPPVFDPEAGANANPQYGSQTVDKPFLKSVPSSCQRA